MPTRTLSSVNPFKTYPGTELNLITPSVSNSLRTLKFTPHSLNIPAFLSVSNFFAGADKKENGKQAYSTYVEIGGHYDFLNDNKIGLSVGAALNKSCYNGYEHDFSICNIEVKYTYNLKCKNDFILPLSVAYITNPVYEKSHVNFIMNLSF